MAYFALAQAQEVLPYALAIAAASFLYVAVADLIPGLHRRVDAAGGAAVRVHRARRRGDLRQPQPGALTAGAGRRTRGTQHRNKCCSAELRRLICAGTARDRFPAMRMDKLTSQFQQALADAQSLAVGRDHQFIEPAHLMLALLDQQGGSVRPLLDAGRRQRARCCARGSARRSDRLPKVEGTAGDVHRLQRPEPPAQRHRQARAAARRPVHRQRAVRARGAAKTRATLGTVAARTPAPSKARSSKAIDELRGGEKVDDPNAEEQRAGAGEIHHRPDRARRAGQARSGDRPRRRDPPHDPGAAAAHQEQSGADRRARRRQDRDRRRPRAAHRQRRSARGPARASACSRSTWAR